MILFADNAELKTNHIGQQGTYARRDFVAGEVLGEDISYPTPEDEPGWLTMTYEEAKRLPSEKRVCFMKFGSSIDFEGGMLGPVGDQYTTHITNYINHSCDPNLWYGKEGDTLVARRDIIAGVLSIQSLNCVTLSSMKHGISSYHWPATTRTILPPQQTSQTSHSACHYYI